jgi:hypothetical protein
MGARNNYKQLGLALEKYGKYVVQQSKSNLTKDKKGGGDLYNSISYDLNKFNKTNNPYVLDFLMENYGPFVDKGVAGVNSTYPETRAALSPFKYGTGTGKKGGLTEGIQAWLEKKKFRWRDELGRYISYKSMRYLIVQKIYFQGIKASLFFTKPFEAGLNKYAKDIIKGYEKDLEKDFNK